MKPILLDLPMPITTPRLIIKPPKVGEGALVNDAIVESFERLQSFMEWAKTMPFLEDSEEYVRVAAANWLLKKNEEPWLQLLIFDRHSKELIGGTSFHHIVWLEYR